ncbi:hypothetical protein [Pontibacter sp. G13]|uniref:hypothetical protein n=1 Tax=Pontibacter sp. G13 TaxID=3074898 RepID=UPI00288B3A8B|nr:hypothetical protein [Pontibacter sp. G13]WNJ21175.1 hypothetical protein RJD25_11965 [Pontibacter sp. G13]
MEEVKQKLADIQEIRSMMEDQVRFVSLSGLSGVGAGVVALLGASGTYLYLDSIGLFPPPSLGRFVRIAPEELGVLIGIASLIFVCALVVAFFFSFRKARKMGINFNSKSAHRSGVNLMIPLAVGALVCIRLAQLGLPGLVAPATLIFYGLALVNSSKFTFPEIRYLGICEIILGLVSTWMIGQGFWFWIVGFGFLHILYGIIMYVKYDRNA